MTFGARNIDRAPDVFTVKSIDWLKIMNEDLEIELQGLKNMVDRLWGSESPSMVKVIVRAKAMLENSGFAKCADARDSNAGDETRKRRLCMKGAKRTKPNKKKTETCEAKGCSKKPQTVLGGYWFCAEHGNRDYEKSNSKVNRPSGAKV